MKVLIAAAAAVAVLSGAPAFAGDTAKPSAQIPTARWSGWYVGATAGYGFGSSSVAIIPLNNAGRSGFVSPVLRDDPRGGLVGATMGMNWQVGNIVYGVETDLSYADVHDVTVGPPLLPPFNFQTTDGQRLEAFGTVRARAGFVLPGGSLLYGTGGLAYGRAAISTFSIDTSADVCNAPPKFCIAGSAAQWKAGWTLGVGWELPIGRSWSVKAEYLYYRLGSVSDSMTDGLAPPENFQGSAAIRGNILRLGVNYALDKS